MLVRRLLFITAAVAVLAAAVTVGVLVSIERNTAAFNGTVLEPPQVAAYFALEDHGGETFRLADARGKVAVLTFLYTSCTDVCPFIAAKFRMAMEQLGEDVAKVEFVAISSDPERDTPERVAAYSRRFDLYDRWHYLIGTEEELKPVWIAYYVGEPIIREGEEEVTEEDLELYGLLRGLDESSVSIANQVRREFGGGYDVGHGTPVWLIGPNGHLRVKLGQDLAPSELVQDIRLLLSRRPE